MSDKSTVKTVDYLERLPNSVNGNPRYKIHCTDGTVLQTQSDASIGYGIGNPELRNVPVRFDLTRNGRVYGATPEPDGAGRDWQEPYRVGGRYDRWYIDRYNHTDASDTGTYGNALGPFPSRRLAQDMATELNRAWLAGAANESPHGRPLTDWRP